MAMALRHRGFAPASASSCSTRSRPLGPVVATASRSDLHSMPSSSTGAPGSTELTRRDLGQAIVTTGALYLLGASPAHAGFQKELKKRKVAVEDYSVLEANGLKFYDLKAGTGDDIKAGDSIIVHWDALFRGIDVQSSRNARLLGGNRTVAEPLSYVVGERVYGGAARVAGESAGGLFSGQSGPKPPLALSLATVGMKKGGKRSLIVDVPALGYEKGIGEMPASATFELQVEVLEVVRRA